MPKIKNPRFQFLHAGTHVGQRLEQISRLTQEVMGAILSNRGKWTALYWGPKTTYVIRVKRVRSGHLDKRYLKNKRPNPPAS